MSYDLRSIRQAVSDYYGNQPHPQAPDLTVNEYPAYERAASMLHSDILQGRKPEPDTVTHTFHTLKNANLSPAEFEQTWTTARPVANRLLNRDPSVIEMATHLKSATPFQIHSYYRDHPYPGYEEVTAGQFADYWRAAEPIARRFGAKPNAEEVSRFAAAGYGSDHIQTHYQESKK